MEKTYSILIQYGDGKPVASKIRAKDGLDAQDKALAAHPGSRSIRVTGVLEVHLPKMKPLPKPKPKAAVYPLFTDVDDTAINSYVKNTSPEIKLQICHQLRSEGLSYKAIAKQLEMGETTVRTWIKNTLPR